MAILYVDLVSGVDGTKAITGASKANPCVVTASSHGFSNGDEVYIYGIVGMTQLNGNRYTIGNVALNTFELTGVDSSGYTTYSSAGTCSNKGTSTVPLLTVNAAVAFGSGPHDIRVAKTAAYTNVAGANFTWTANSVTVATDADVRASIAIGDWIGKTTAAGNGAEETFYYVISITASTITLYAKYGGVTGTESSCNKVIPVVTGAVNANPIMQTGSNTILSGGWNLSGSPVQDGETWFKGNASWSAGYLAINCTVSGTTISKLNAAYVYTAIYGTTNYTVNNCTFLAYYGAISSNSSGTTFNNVMASGYTYYVVQTSFSGNVFNGCIFQGGTGWTQNGVIVFQTYPPVFNNCKIISGSTYGIYVGCNSTRISTLSIRNCTGGINYAYGNSLVDGLTCTNTGGLYFGADIGSVRISNSVFNGGVAATFYTRCQFIEFLSCSFNSNSNCIVTNDGATKDISFINCSFLTPTNYVFNRAVSTGVFYAYDCTVDTPSLSKLYNTETTVGYLQKKFVFDNSFGKTGTIYASASLLKDSNVFRTNAPSLALQFGGDMPGEMKVVSAYVAAGSTRTYSIWIMTSNSLWAGTITPIWKLNKVPIKTETVISSLSNTVWTQFSYTIDGGLISRDGELSLDFKTNMNSYPIYIDDFTVT